MNHVSSRWRRRLLTVILCALGLVPALTAQAASGQAASGRVAGPAAFGLLQVAGTPVVVDDSSVTGCIGTDPQPVAYRPDRIVVRPPAAMPNAAAVAAVNAALGDLHSRARVTGVEEITFPGPPPGPSAPAAGSTARALDPDPDADLDPSSDPEGEGEGVRILSLSLGGDGEQPPGEQPPVVQLARRLRQPPHYLLAAPDYLVEPSSGPTGMWPDGFPEPAAALEPPRAAGLGAGVTIAMYDTGLPSPTQSNHPPNVTRLTVNDTETLDATVPPDGIVDHYYGGHTVAGAGVMATLAPGASVVAARITEADGVATDVSATRRMAATLRNANAGGNWPDLIVNLFGSPACDADPANPGPELAPLGLRTVTEVVDQHDQALIVASAGNESTSRRYYPAAFPTVIAVGALDATADGDGSAWTAPSRSGPPANFSNHGPWVDVWAPGVDLATTHVNGLRFEAGGPVINGMALVGGTSFAAPSFVALIAEHMAATGLDAEAAAAAIAASGTRCSAAVGGGVAVALTTMSATATSPARSGTPAAC